MLVAVVSTIAGVLVAAMLTFFAWLAVSIMNLRAGQHALEIALEEGQKRIVSELRGEFAIALARMETRLMAATCGREPPRLRDASCDERDD